MYVRNHMIKLKDLVSLNPEENVKDALKKINSKDFLSLPVISENKILGILMKEAIYRKYFEEDFTSKEDFLTNCKVKDIYNKDLKIINESEPIEEASYLLNNRRTPFLAVIDDKGNFVGILTHAAIFKAFSEIFGLEIGQRLVIHMFDIPGQLARLTDILKKENINIMNLTLLDTKVMGIIKVVLRVDTANIEELVLKLEKEGFKIGEFGE
ncbi:CBS domain-containing protein [Soehngenia longivitae]|uniref:CBS domain-containing protein n=1 Tax=Soehngenia longivitae TaxID=2562294 RepID=A0A4Z0D2H6_9FIRM|nr:CBS domain-containing protein [Soehngenia longivitae]TFZ39528.1 CBS domain-containing protein [Soehngenia longivitae]